MDPWSKGDYSRHIPATSMVVEWSPEVNPPSGRVPGQLLPAIPRLESRRRRNSGRNRVTGPSSRVSGARGKYRTKGGHPWPRWPGGAATPLAAPGGRLGALANLWLPPLAYITPSSQKPSGGTPHRDFHLCSAAVALPRSGASEDPFPAPCRREDRPPEASRSP